MLNNEIDQRVYCFCESLVVLTELLIRQWSFFGDEFFNCSLKLHIRIFLQLNYPVR